MPEQARVPVGIRPYSSALAGFIQWLAARRSEIIGAHKERIAELQSELQKHTTHKRTPGIIAELAWAAERFVQFAVEVGAFSQQGGEATAFYHRCLHALQEAAESQAEHQAACDPVPRFQELLSSAIVAGRAHVATTDER